MRRLRCQVLQTKQHDIGAGPVGGVGPSRINEGSQQLLVGSECHLMRQPQLFEPETQRLLERGGGKGSPNQELRGGIWPARLHRNKAVSNQRSAVSQTSVA